MPEGAQVVQDSWARNIRIKELQEERDKVCKESWGFLKAKRIDEAITLRRRQEGLDAEISKLKAEEAKAKERTKAAKEAAAANAGILAVPDKGSRLLALQEELEQARLADDFDRAIEARKGMLALEEGPASSSSSGARPPLALPAPPSGPLALTADATNPDFDPRENPGVEIEVPVRRRRGGTVPTGKSGSTGRAAERYSAMRAELQQAVEAGDDEAAADLRRRLEVFQAHFAGDREDGDATAELPGPAPQPRRRRGGGKGSGGGGGGGGRGDGAAGRAAGARGPRPEPQPRGRGRRGQEAHAADAAVEDAAAGSRARARPGAGPGRRPAHEAAAPATGHVPKSGAGEATAEQARAREQLEAWQQEFEWLEQGLEDYRGDDDCKQALELRQRMEDVGAKIQRLRQATATGGSALQAALRAIDQAKNPDAREAQLAALAKLNETMALR
mmetsp:Transcript_76258/g.235450  ORF Transcript_76258/g.235450 Transcript_76258/m.235450 type:complete len:447 (+) Transcript_76258:70-1410(+)